MKDPMELSSLLEGFRCAANRYAGVLSQLRRHEIPDSYTEFCTDGYSPTQMDPDSLILRDTFLEISGYCLIAYDWVRPLSKWIGERRCLELMCGCGCLAKALQDCEVDVIATDDFSWTNHDQCWFQNPWTKIEQLTAVEAIRKYGPHVSLILMSWPYVDETALTVLKEVRLWNPGAQMIFIGEWNGATANGGFFREARRVNDPGFYEAVRSFRQHATINDRPYLLR